MNKEQETNWIGISDRKQLIKIFKDYVSLRLPIKASIENWPINNQTNLSMIIINAITSQSILSFEESLTDDQLKLGIKICMEIELAGLSRLALYHKKNKVKDIVKVNI